MAEAARARPAPLHPGLPDEIFIWEVLLRLPLKDLLRCRAVCRGWRRTTSARDFLLAHHTRQPSLPLLYELRSTDGDSVCLDIVPLDRRAGAAAADQLHSVARLGIGGVYTHIEASCDGLLILSTFEGDSDYAYYSVCNPATRQYAPLPPLLDFCFAGMYPHPPTGEYRLLMYRDALLMHDEPEPGTGYECYVYTLGSCEQPRRIRWPEAEAEEAIHMLEHLLFRGGLHWFIEKDESNKSCMIMVFDTISELFRQMRAPAVPRAADLFEMDGVLGMASFSDGATKVDIWTMQDYDSEVWTFKYRVKLPVEDLTVRFGLNNYLKLVVSSSDDDNVLILVQCDEWLHQIDMGGKLVASVQRKYLALCCIMGDYYSVCNPATRQYAPLPQLRGFCISGMYPHPPTGEYRLLMCTDALLEHERDEPVPAAGYGLYVYTLGSCEPPRAIGWPNEEAAIHTIDSVLFHGDLHWFIEKDGSESCMIMVFDTIAELFRPMRAPAVPCAADLFEMDGVLGMASFSDGVTTIDVWTMKDYDSEVWAFKYRVELPVAELTVRFGIHKYNSKLVVSYSDDDDVLILVKAGEWLLQIDIAGKLVASFHRKLLGITQFRFKQTLVPHTFFPTIGGYVVNDWPFISPADDYVVDT